MSGSTTTKPAVRRTTSRRLGQEDTQRLIQMGRISASLLHEISLPITATLLHLENGSSSMTMNKNILRNMLLLQRYVEAARQQLRQEYTAEFFYLRAAFVQVNRLVLPAVRQSGSNLSINLKGNYRLYGSQILFQQILTNLILNAIESYEEADIPKHLRTIRITITSTQRLVIIRVRDQGPGIASSEIDKLFNEFYSSKPNKGLGLGLSIVKQHVENCFRGSIHVTSSTKVTTFTIKLPVHRDASS